MCHIKGIGNPNAVKKRKNSLVRTSSDNITTKEGGVGKGKGGKGKRKKIKMMKKTKKQFLLENEYLKLSFYVWFDLFHSVIDPIVKHVAKMFSNHRKALMNKKLKYIILVGGLSSSAYVKSQLMEKLRLGVHNACLPHKCRKTMGRLFQRKRERARKCDLSCLLSFLQST